jgi:hypothetical protein
MDAMIFVIGDVAAVTQSSARRADDLVRAAMSMAPSTAVALIAFVGAPRSAPSRLPGADEATAEGLCRARGSHAL